MMCIIDNKTSTKIPIERKKIVEFCRNWKIAKLELFGSVLRDDFRDDSDVDFLVTFMPNARWSLLDHVDMEDDLAVIVGRKVDLVTKRSVERSQNWIRRKSIINNAKVFYIA
ncbi:MAG: nucleotidyltransferase domain-containing protein [Candidatus Hatepunaea meridiana]|nr:nucleotidyltransferase domain-containing protein [Candidatus Hatepunaea meridiana]